MHKHKDKRKKDTLAEKNTKVKMETYNSKIEEKIEKSVYVVQLSTMPPRQWLSDLPMFANKNTSTKVKMERYS